MLSLLSWGYVWLYWLTLTIYWSGCHTLRLLIRRKNLINLARKRLLLLELHLRHLLWVLRLWNRLHMCLRHLLNLLLLWSVELCNWLHLCHLLWYWLLLRHLLWLWLRLRHLLRHWLYLRHLRHLRYIWHLRYILLHLLRHLLILLRAYYNVLRLILCHHDWLSLNLALMHEWTIWHAHCLLILWCECVWNRIRVRCGLHVCRKRWILLDLWLILRSYLCELRLRLRCRYWWRFGDGWWVFHSFSTRWKLVGRLIILNLIVLILIAFKGRWSICKRI